MLKDQNRGSGSIVHELSPNDRAASEAYRHAFVTAWRIIDPQLPSDKKLYPCAPDDDDANKLVRELDMEPVHVPSEEIRNILQYSGAFSTIKEFAKAALLASPLYAGQMDGIIRFERAITQLLPATSAVVVKDYRHSYPKVAWDLRQKQLS
ncbi:hypothetical protein HWV62_45077 [Athelia sp. TMB]|nr:hypothetical protein HWV62_45077 [Athelia sp. TMB]